MGALVVYVPSDVLSPFVVIFRLLVPVCACSVLLFIVVFAPFFRNPVVVPRVSVPVCWLGVRRLLCVVSVSVAVMFIVSLW